MATASPASGDKFDRALEAARSAGRCPDTRGRYKRTALRALAQEHPETKPWSPFPLLLSTLAIVLIVLALSVVHGCVPAQAIGQAEREANGNAGHALDETLPLEARQVGGRAARAWAAQFELLTGDELDPPLPDFPPEVAPVESRS